MSEQVQELISMAKARLILDHTFFAAVLLRHEITITDRVPTAACTPRGQIYINPQFAMQHANTPGKMMFLLAHECLHYMLMHGLRRGERDAAAWNIAGDKVINDTLIDAKVGDWIDGGVTEADARNKATEDLYNEDEAGQGVGGIGPDIEYGSGALDEAEVSQIEAEVRMEIAQAAQAARMAGKMPGGLQRLVDEILQVKTPWYQILERHMVAVTKEEYSWARPNRRHVHSGVYLPSAGNIPKMGEVVVGVDTSGSIGAKELAVFQGHMNRILEACRPTKLHVVYCDSRVGSTDEYTLDDLPAKFKNPSGGGGTSFGPVFDWVDRNDIQPDVLVYLTDMHGDFPERAPDYPTVWLSTSHISTAPFGEVVQYEAE